LEDAKESFAAARRLFQDSCRNMQILENATEEKARRLSLPTGQLVSASEYRWRDESMDRLLGLRRFFSAIPMVGFGLQYVGYGHYLGGLPPVPPWAPI
jgi:hypothetical protein